MHLLLAQKGSISESDEAVDLGQSAGDILFLSAADTELASLAEAQKNQLPSMPSLRLANFMQLSHPMSVDVYAEKMVGKSRLIIVRLLGGKAYWDYGVETLHALPLSMISSSRSFLATTSLIPYWKVTPRLPKKTTRNYGRI